MKESGESVLTVRKAGAEFCQSKEQRRERQEAQLIRGAAQRAPAAVAYPLPPPPAAGSTRNYTCSRLTVAQLSLAPYDLTS